MRHKLTWALVLLVLVALAGPAAAAPRAGGGLGGIHGVVRNAATGAEFADGLLAVDAFNLNTMTRTVEYVPCDTSGSHYALTDLPPGPYKVRFRYWNDAGQLQRYRWNSNKSNFDVADAVTVIAGASLQLDASLRIMRGAPVAGTLVESGTGVPLTTKCYGIHLYEASGIGLGWLDAPQPTGAWEVPKVPAGRWTALAYYVTGVIDWDGEGGEPPVDCGTSPAHLDTWYRGASGWPIPSGVVSDGHTFTSARTFSVLTDVPVGNIEIEMLPAPTCRGRVPTIFGTTLADEIVGTGARDIIAALGGDDWIHGKAGNDLICGGAGNDTIDAGAGLRDAVDGGPGLGDVCQNAETTWRCP